MSDKHAATVETHQRDMQETAAPPRQARGGSGEETRR